MNKKGKIASVNSDKSKAKVIFDDMNVMTVDLDIALHISATTIRQGSEVIVAFYNDTLKDGIIIGVVQ